MGNLLIKRVYLPAGEEDGTRILIDRLWPRGVTKEKAAADEWDKDITPSPALRKWFGHKEENFGEFSRKYREELDSNPAAVPFAQHVGKLLESDNVTLLYGAKSPVCNHAVILRDWILEHRGGNG